jgi:MoaA/NifB/PqqE/SkfB family radical SAM enzyme
MKQLFDRFGDDRSRTRLLLIAELLGIRKNIVRMDTNDLCNIECIMCGARTKNPARQRYMALPDFEKVMDKVRPMTRFLYLSCGFEPLVTPKIEQYFAYTKNGRGGGIPFVSLCTNGLLLTDAVIRSLVENQINEIIFSINGFNEADYNRIMHKSDYGRVTENIRRLNEYKKAKRS